MATNRSNFGTFVPVESLDWGKAIGGLYDTINKIGLDREQQRQDLDKIMTDSISAINNSELLKTQSLQDYVLAGAENGRNVINDANKRLKAGQMKPAEYRAIINNVNSYWSTMSNSMKNFDATNQEVMKRLQPGEDGSAPAGSEFEEFLVKKHANLSDLRNSSYMFSPDSGEGYMVKIDPVTGQTKKVINSMSIADPSNIMDQRYDFEKEIVTATRGMKNAYTMEDGTVTIKDPMKNESVANSVSALITAMTNNSRTTAQALARYGGYDFFEDEEDRIQIIQSAINDEEKSRRIQGKPALTDSEKENMAKNVSDRLIKVSLDLNNRYEPQISPEQQIEAEAILEDLIVAQFPVSRTEDETPIGRSGRTGSRSTDTVDKKSLGLARRVKSALSIKDDTETKENVVKELNKIIEGDDKRVIWTGSAFAIEKYNPKGKKDRRGNVVGGSWEITVPKIGWSVSAFGPTLGFKSGSSLEKWNEAVESLK
jgi:hypothetical protein